QQMPLARTSCEVVQPPILELETGPDDQVPHGTRDQHFPWSGHRRHLGAGANRDPAELLSHQVALAGVQPGAKAKIERAERLANGAGATDGSGGAVEGGQDALAGRLDVLATEMSQLAP